jgi:membrane protein implicated in regulation of membrane protease activity
MKHIFVALALLALVAGCKSSLPPAAPNAGTMAELNKSQSSADDKVSAAVAAASEANDKGNPPAVKAELKVAAAFLPEVKPGELLVANQRVESKDPKAYEGILADALKIKKEKELVWAKMESERAANESKMKEQQNAIAQLKADVEKAKAEGEKNLYTMGAIGLFLVGAVLMGFSRYTAGGAVMLAGLLCGAVPDIKGSPYFAWVIGIFLASIAGITVWVVFKRAKHNLDDKIADDARQNAIEDAKVKAIKDCSDAAPKE